MFDPDIHIPDIARGAAIPPAMQLEFKRQEQEKRRYRIALVQSWGGFWVWVARRLGGIIAVIGLPLTWVAPGA